MGTFPWRSIVFTVLLTLFAVGRAPAAEPLPAGAAPAPVEFPHFPDRLHAVVWRNWQLVEPARLARVLGTTEEKVNALAESMGLPPAGRVLPEWRRRGYITLVRRNWHLLPYEQLLTLLDMSAEELAVSLREDDFLFVKLGNAKPRCEPVRYAEPDAPARRRAAQIKQVVARNFADALARPGEPAFRFVTTLSAPLPPGTQPRAPAQGLRLIYSYFGTYGDPLTDPDLDPYPDGLLGRLAASGVNAVWLHVVLRQMAPGGKDFPEFGAGHEQRLKNLRRLVERAARHGIAVYLYINEPRAMPAAFFARRPEMAGVADGDFRTLCTSDARVRRWLEDALAHVFAAVPGLGGVFTITASENLTSCASHGRAQDCPRCSRRSADEIIAEVNAAIVAGVRRGNPKAQVLLWDWGWHNHGEAPGLIARLPKEAWLMSVSEWSQPVVRGGIRTQVGEYSLSVPGPGPRATRHWALAREAGLKTVAKVQLNTTWELSAVPYLPVMDLVAEHCTGLARARVDGLMLSWTLGSYPSPNLRIAERLMGQRGVTAAQVLDELAAELYGPDGAPHARKAWTAFSRSFAEFPYHGQVVYQGPQQMGPANLLYGRPTGYRATMVGIPYDDLDGWRGPYPADVFAGQFEKVARGWGQGLEALQKAVDRAPAARRESAAADLRLARAAGLHFASVANQARFVMARNALARAGRSALERARAREELLQALDDEVRLARELFALCRADSRIGFEATNHYYYVPLDLIEKVINCEHLRSELAARP
jgi:hypothetical protein